VHTRLFSSVVAVLAILSLARTVFATPVFINGGSATQPVMCTQARIAISKPGAAFTVYSLLPKGVGDAEQLASGPQAIGVAANGDVWFAMPYGKAIGRIRGASALRCPVPPREDTMKLFDQEIGASAPPNFQPTIHALLPARATAYTKAGAPNGATWFTVEYAGMHGNPTNAGILGRLDQSNHLRMYHVPAANDNAISIAVARDGTLWLGDYFRENIIHVDPAKL
jgi:hypothetical protein